MPRVMPKVNKIRRRSLGVVAALSSCAWRDLIAISQHQEFCLRPCVTPALLAQVEEEDLVEEVDQPPTIALVEDPLLPQVRGGPCMATEP